MSGYTQVLLSLIREFAGRVIEVVYGLEKKMYSDLLGDLELQAWQVDVACG